MKQIEAPPLENLGPLLIAPPEFRQNSLFYGFQFELDRLHVELSNQKKRSIGTSAVVLWGPPGKLFLPNMYRCRPEVVQSLSWYASGRGKHPKPKAASNPKEVYLVMANPLRLYQRELFPLSRYVLIRKQHRLW